MEFVSGTLVHKTTRNSKLLRNAIVLFNMHAPHKHVFQNTSKQLLPVLCSSNGKCDGPRSSKHPWLSDADNNGNPISVRVFLSSSTSRLGRCLHPGDTDWISYLYAHNVYPHLHVVHHLLQPCITNASASPRCINKFFDLSM